MNWFDKVVVLFVFLIVIVIFVVVGVFIVLALLDPQLWPLGCIGAALYVAWLGVLYLEVKYG